MKQLVAALPIVLGGLVLVPSPSNGGETVTLYFNPSGGSGTWSEPAWVQPDCAGLVHIQFPDNDDHAVICEGVTCTLDVDPEVKTITLQEGATLNIGSGRQLTLNDPDGTSTIGTDAVINLDGTITIELGVAQVDHTFAGDGEIVGDDSGARIEIDSSQKLINEITIRGIMEIARINDPGTGEFENRGTVHADRSGTLKLSVWIISDVSPGGGVTPQWKVTNSGARLEMAASCDNPGFCSSGLIGDFLVSRGKLKVTSTFATEGVLTQQLGGVIEVPDGQTCVFSFQPES